MWKALYVVLIAAAFAYAALPTETTPDRHQTNSPAKVSIRELLENKELWNSNRVEVLGYYRCFFEHSVLTAHKGGRPNEGIWVDIFRIAPDGRGRIGRVSNDFVRVIGVFKVYEGRGAGHLNMCPAEISNLELLEKTKEPLPTK